MNILDWLKQLKKQKPAPQELPDAAVMDLLRYLENCGPDCEDVFNALDQYAEIELRREDAARLMPLVHEHLETCTDCCDQYEALLDVLEKASNTPKS